MSLESEQLAAILEDAGAEYAQVEWREGAWWFRTPTAGWQSLGRNIEAAIDAAKTYDASEEHTPAERWQAYFDNKVEKIYSR